MGDRLTDAELIARLKLVEKHGTVTAAARASGLHRSSLNALVKEAQAKGLTAATPIKDPLVKAKIDIADLRRHVASLEREADTAAAIRQEIYNLASHTPEPPKWLVDTRRAGSNRGTPFTMWSDWHYGEVVRKEEVGGVNVFNSAVAAERIKTLTNNVIEIAYEHMGRADKEYPGIVVMLGGDMISGDIHEELAQSNDRTPHQCINDLTDLIAAALTSLADKFGRVFVPCVVGNHGRGSHKPRMKGRVFTSFEWNIYCALERHFKIAKDNRVSFYIPEETDAYFRVYGHRTMLTHGDSLGVKGGDGIIGSIGPIMRGALKIGRSEAQIGRDFDNLVMGHWHQMLWLPGVTVNGALKGYDEYARLALRAPYSRPSQALWFVHPQHGMTARWEVFLDERRKFTTDKEWVSVLREKK